MSELTLKRVTKGGSKQSRSRIVKTRKAVRNFQYNIEKAAKHADEILDLRQIGDMNMRQDIDEFIKKAERWHDIAGKW